MSLIGKSEDKINAAEAVVKDVAEVADAALSDDELETVSGGLKNPLPVKAKAIDDIESIAKRP